MRSVDTNVLVRFWIDDDPKQSAAVRRLFEASSIWISRTVLLETAWVLRSIFGYEQAAISNAFRSLLGTDNVEVEDPASLSEALSLCATGVEFADALHLCSGPKGAIFVTFDAMLIKRARRAGVSNVALP